MSVPSDKIDFYVKKWHKKFETLGYVFKNNAYYNKDNKHEILIEG